MTCKRCGAWCGMFAEYCSEQCRQPPASATTCSHCQSTPFVSSKRSYCSAECENCDIVAALHFRETKECLGSCGKRNKANTGLCKCSTDPDNCPADKTKDWSV